MKPLFSFIFLICNFLLSAQDTLHLPLTYRTGLGPFGFGGGMNKWKPITNPDCEDWCKCEPSFTGIPADWKNVEKMTIQTDMFQYSYQCYKAGSMSEEMFKELTTDWEWTVDESMQSPQPLVCYVSLIRGTLPNEETEIRLDVNGNQDFSDDKPITILTPPAYKDNPIAYQNFVDSLVKNAHQVRVQYLYNGVRKDTIAPFIITKSEMPKYFVSTFPVYAQATLTDAEHSTPILISWGSGRPYNCREARRLLPIVHDTLWTKADYKLQVNKEDFFSIGNQTYQFVGTDYKKQTLTLLKVKVSKDTYYPQTGFKAPLFTGKDINGNTLDLSQLKGKYVFLDFWTAGCKPCIEEMPLLQKIHEQYDPTQFALIGIVPNSIEVVNALTQPQGATYPQIWGEKGEEIHTQYKVVSYPTTYLIDPEGRIIARDLRGELITKALDKYLKKP